MVDMTNHSTNSAVSLADLKAGDRVIVKRNLDHPAWKTFVDDEHGGHWSRVRGVEEIIGVMTISERRAIRALPGWPTWCNREAQTLVRAAENGFWYDCATGEQANCSATLIEPAPAQ